MYQEAIEQAGREINIFEFAQFSLTCPGTEFGILQPNPELERVDAALAAMCQPEDDFPVLPRPDIIDDFNAITFIEEDLLEKVFELYDGDRHRFDSDIYQVGSQYNPCLSRSYHPGRIYGSGHYGSAEQEARYQSFIRDPIMVFEVLDEFNSQKDEKKYQREWDEPDIYPHDLLVNDGLRLVNDGLRLVNDGLRLVNDGLRLVNDGLRLVPEPFIRAPVISYEAAVIMEEEFHEAYWDKQYQQGLTLGDLEMEEDEYHENW